MTRFNKRILQASTVLAMGAGYLGTAKSAEAATSCPAAVQVSSCEEVDSGMCDSCGGSSFNCGFYNGPGDLGGVDPYDPNQVIQGPGVYAFCAWAC
jgi:hypothetical protein